LVDEGYRGGISFEVETANGGSVIGLGRRRAGGVPAAAVTTGIREQK
jgi:hypothetical protein